MPETMPKTMLVVGSGAIGIEFASFYATMGVDVTVVEIVDRILPVEDKEIAKIAQKQLERAGLKFITGAKVSGVNKAANSVTATIEDAKGTKTELTVDRMISAVGVVGNIEDLGLEALGVKPTGAAWSSMSMAAPTLPVFTPLAMWPDRPCWPTRPSMKGWCALRRSPA